MTCFLTLMLVVCFLCLATPSCLITSDVASVCGEYCSTDTNNVVEDDGWILIGEVTMTHVFYRDSTIKADLYVREIAHSVIYRIEYGGKYYSVKSCYYIDGTLSHYETVIGKITYKLDYK